MEWMSRAALEYIGRGGFGHTFDALNESSRNGYGEAVKMLVYVIFSILKTKCQYFLVLSRPLSSTLFAFRPLLPTMIQIGTAGFRRKVVEWTPIKTVQQLRHIVDLMHETSIEIYSKKLNGLKKGDQAVVEQIGNGKDIMSILRACQFLQPFY